MFARRQRPSTDEAGDRAWWICAAARCSGVVLGPRAVGGHRLAQRAGTRAGAQPQSRSHSTPTGATQAPSSPASTPPRSSCTPCMWSASPTNSPVEVRRRVQPERSGTKAGPATRRSILRLLLIGHERLSPQGRARLAAGLIPRNPDDKVCYIHVAHKTPKTNLPSQRLRQRVTDRTRSCSD